MGRSKVHRKRGAKCVAMKKAWAEKKAMCSLHNIFDDIEEIGNNVENNPILTRGETEEEGPSTLAMLEDMEVDKNCDNENPYNITEVVAVKSLLENNPQWCHKTYVPRYFNDSGIISSDQYSSIINHNLTYEVQESAIEGNRIVELEYILNTTIDLQFKHGKDCSGKLFVASELRKQLKSTILFKCTMCDKTFKTETEDPKRRVSEVNYGAVWGTLATGSTYGHLEEVLSCLNVPSMDDKTFYNIENIIGEEVSKSLLASMEAAGKLEKEHAIGCNQLCLDGTPWIRVYVDGSWSKRSYGTNFNSLSGMVGIIGKHTGKLLFVGVKNRYCQICNRAENKGDEPKEHTCYRNWSESAPSMESELAVEGFCESESMHGVRYMEFVADGDSSLFAQIRQKVPYGPQVRKLECTNHALKNFGKNLRKIKADTHIRLEGRKLLTTNKIHLLTKRAKCSIYEHSKAEIRNLDQFREDLRNNLHHVFGDHQKCRPDICNDIGNGNNNKIPALQTSGIYEHLYGAGTLLVRKAHLLIDKENNNPSEQFMNIVARFNMGKRLNLIQRGSYERRVYMAALRHNESFGWYCSPMMTLQQTPGIYLDRYIKKHSRKHAVKRKLCGIQKSTSVLWKKSTKNVHYGERAEQAHDEHDEEIIRTEADIVIQNLQVSKEEIASIQKETVGQFDNPKYQHFRRNRLTASLFGKVIKKRPYTSCHGIVKTCLSADGFFTEATEYGKTKECVAKRKFQEVTKLQIIESGLWVDPNHGFLGASPDGLIGEDSIVEVKCIYAPLANFTSWEELLQIKRSHFLQIINGSIQLKRNHTYYYQIQGQLNITQRKKCYFIVYVNDDLPLHIEEIFRDEELWCRTMLSPLVTFFKECVAPEIIRGNLKRGQRCIDPPHILDAIADRDKKLEERKRNKEVTEG